MGYGRDASPIEKRKGRLNTMKIYSEISLENFEAWSGAVNTLDRIRNAGKCDILESVLESEYPDGLSETELNDLLWFDPDWCYEACGMRSESEIRAELEEAEEELEDLKQNYADDCELIDEESEEDEVVAEDRKQECWIRDYKDDADALEEKIAELKEELENI